MRKDERGDKTLLLRALLVRQLRRRRTAVAALGIEVEILLRPVTDVIPFDPKPVTQATDRYKPAWGGHEGCCSDYFDRKRTDTKGDVSHKHIPCENIEFPRMSGERRRGAAASVFRLTRPQTAPARAFMR
jgi:hypothetical protein